MQEEKAELATVPGNSQRFSTVSSLDSSNGGADGIRIRQLYGNKGVVRRTLAFYGIERKGEESLVPP